MTNSDLFKKAHKIARLTAKAAGSYKIAFVAALADLRSGKIAAQQSITSVYAMAKNVLAAYGAKEWRGNKGTMRVYLNNCNVDMDYEAVNGGTYFTMTDCDRETARFLLWVAFNAAALMGKAPARKTSRVVIDDEEEALSYGWSAYADAANAGCKPYWKRV